MNTQPNSAIVIIGGGPSGLMAAEQLTQAGYSVDLYDAMPSVGRKFLLAGIGGLNITHSEPFEDFIQRYAERTETLLPYLRDFGAEQLRTWCHDLGIETFIGTSGRVFPKAMKAAPLLRAWLTRLKQQGLRIHARHRWLGWNQHGQLRFAHAYGEKTVDYSALILALGGGSWKKLGSDGAWYPWLAQRGIELAPLQPSNCGFLCNWSEHLRHHYAGSPVKSIALQFTDLQGKTETRRGELIITHQGVEGSLIYAFSARLRHTLLAQHQATFYLDLLPQHSLAQVQTTLAHKPANKSLGSFLKSKWKLEGIKSALIFEKLPKEKTGDMLFIAQLLKALPITVTATTPLDEAISTAGGVKFEALHTSLMLKTMPGVFCAGEMLDWDAPTGGYLLTACFATGKQVGLSAVQWLQHNG